MSVSLWAWTEECDGRICVGDCDLCSADVVEVVRCKDCKHFHDGIYNGEYWMECDEYRIALSSDEWFCADGERREDDKGRSD